MTKGSNRVLVAVLCLVGYAVVVAVNAVATTTAIGGMTTGQVSDLYPNLFVPAGLTFSIWGVIYILLGIYVVYGLARSLRASEPGSTFVDGVGPLFIVTCVANAGWIFAWGYRIVPVSLAVMVVLLASLIAIYTRLDIGRAQASAAEKYMVHLPMSIYLGWITVATIANVTALLVYYKWDGFGLSQQAWAIVMIVVAVAFGLVFLFRRRDPFYTLVIDWAVLGILIKRTATDPQSTRAEIITAIVSICVLTLGILTQLIRRRVYR